MNRYALALGGAGLLLGVSVLAAQAQVKPPITPPDPPKFDAQGKIDYVGAADILEFNAHTSLEPSGRAIKKSGTMSQYHPRLPKPRRNRGNSVPF